MTAQWLKFYRLPRRDKVLLWRAAGYLIVYCVALRWLGLAGSVALSGARAGPPRRLRRAIDPGYPVRASLACDRARRLLGIGTCLSRSLALRRMLASAGVEAAVRIGARRTASGMTAHAWVESDLLAAPEGGTGFPPFPARL